MLVQTSVFKNKSTQFSLKNNILATFASFTQKIANNIAQHNLYELEWL